MNASQHASTLPFGAAHAHAELLARKDLQFDFPAITTPSLPGWFLALLKWIGTVRPLFQDAAWILLGCGIVLLIWFVGRKVWRRNRRSAGNGVEAIQPVAQWLPASHAAKLLLADADALAADGRYGEAAHLLLLRGIQDIAERHPSMVRPALTSREIGELQQLPMLPRDAFKHIAQTVELALFAGHALGADDFRRCRTECEHFAFPSGWSPDAAQ